MCPFRVAKFYFCLWSHSLICVSELPLAMRFSYPGNSPKHFTSVAWPLSVQIGESIDRASDTFAFKDIPYVDNASTGARNDAGFVPADSNGRHLRLHCIVGTAVESLHWWVLYLQFVVLLAEEFVKANVVLIVPGGEVLMSGWLSILVGLELAAESRAVDLAPIQRVVLWDYRWLTELDVSSTHFWIFDSLSYYI